MVAYGTETLVLSVQGLRHPRTSARWVQCTHSLLQQPSGSALCRPTPLPPARNHGGAQDRAVYAGRQKNMPFERTAEKIHIPAFCSIGYVTVEYALKMQRVVFRTVSLIMRKAVCTRRALYQPDVLSLATRQAERRCCAVQSSLFSGLNCTVGDSTVQYSTVLCIADTVLYVPICSYSNVFLYGTCTLRSTAIS